MKSLEYVKKHIDDIEHDILDSRFTKRFLDFLPWTEWEYFGFKVSDTFDPATYTPKEWTEENILAQLKEDVEFGVEKATDHRGISASLMFSVVQSWCIILENGLENTDYGWYGDKLFKAVDEHYGWGLTKDAFDQSFYEEW